MAGPLEGRSTHPEYNRESTDDEEREENPIAEARVGRGFARGRQREIGIADGVEIDARENPSHSVHHPAYSIIRDAYQG